MFGNRFNWCVLAAAFLAQAEGRLGDSRYVQKLAYEFYESGAFRDRVSPPRQLIDASAQDVLSSPRATRTESDE